MKRLARRLRLTEGQAYTSVTGLVVGLTMLLWGVPPTLEERPARPAPVAAPTTPVTPNPSTSTAPLPAPTGATPAPLRTSNVVALPPPIRRPQPLPSPTSAPPPTSPPSSTPTSAPEPQPTTSSSPTPSAAPSPRPSPTSQPDTEPTIELARYASASGPLLGAPGDEGQFLPVGARAGEADKQSYLRFDTPPSGLLTLTMSTDPFHNLQEDVIGVLACPITESAWELADGAPLADAPAHDPEACVSGLPLRDGTWTFTVNDLDRGNGLALLPDVSALVSAQVVFEVTPTPAPENAR